MTTAATGSIRFGGSGFGPDYVSRRTRRVQKDEQQEHASSNSNLNRRPEEDLEVFLFTVKDPVRSALNQLMSVIKINLLENPAYGQLGPEVISGPLGYTTMRAVRPVAFIPTKTIFRPITR